MKSKQIKSNQTALKSKYREAPESARQTLWAEGTVDFDNLAVKITHPPSINLAGMHSASGGDGTFQCPVEIMLAGLVSCAGVTLAAVASSIQMPVEKVVVRAEGELDFRGTLAVDRDAPVGLQSIRLDFDLHTSADGAAIDKLMELTLRYCVVHRTLQQVPAIDCTVHVTQEVEDI